MDTFILTVLLVGHCYLIYKTVAGNNNNDGSGPDGFA